MSPQEERDRESLAETGRVWQRQGESGRDKESLAGSEREPGRNRDSESLAEAETQRVWQRQRQRLGQKKCLYPLYCTNYTPKLYRAKSTDKNGV